LYFIYTPYTVFMHLSTSDGTDWAADVFGFSDLPTGLYGVVDIVYRMQIGRTPNGDKLFFSWTNSDSTAFTEHVAPDLYVMGYDIATDCYTNPMNVSAGTDYEYATYYPNLSPVVMDNGAGEYELPIVFAQPGALDTDPAEFIYIKGLTMTDADFCGEPAADANFTFSVTDATANFTNTSSNATTYSWDFGDGSGTSPLENPTYTYTASGTYEVCLTASNASSSDTECKNVTATVVGIEDMLLNAALNIFPTPANEVVNINLNGAFSNVTVSVFNMLGESVLAPVTMNGSASTLNVAGLAEGNYIVKLNSDNGVAVRQITIAR
jgi:PKD repeat protein